MNIELKPCPFCGGEPTMSSYTYSLSGAGIQYKVECERHDCPAQPTVDWHYWTAEEAAEAWNTRAERTCKNVNEEWEKTSFAHAATSFCCSECGAHYVDCESYYAALAGADEEQIRTNYCPNCGAKVVE